MYIDLNGLVSYGYFSPMFWSWTKITS